MSTISPVVAAKHRGGMPGFSGLQFIDLEELGVAASPLAVLDDFRVGGIPFSPHPHAGFAAVTYVFEDSDGAVRSRSSSGVDLTVGPGGIVWTEAGSGVVHEEVPAVVRHELHGMQLFVNLSGTNKLTPPRVLHLEPDEVPIWQGDGGDRVRVVVGTFGGLASPLVPVEPFTLLDGELHRSITVDVPEAHNTVVYVRSGAVVVGAGDDHVRVDGSHAVAIRGGGARVTIDALEPAQILVLDGAEIVEPIVAEGPFIMSDSAQIRDAISRFQSGAMGQLAPLPHEH